MIHWLQTAFNTYWLHPLHANGYQWWSGAGSDLGEVSIFGVVLVHFRHHNCHVKGCWRLGHADLSGRVTCRRHLDT